MISLVNFIKNLKKKQKPNSFKKKQKKKKERNLSTHSEASITIIPKPDNDIRRKL